MSKLFWYLNPVFRLGYNRYSILFPFIATVTLSICSEVFALLLIGDPGVVGRYIIFFHVAFIIYFSFRDGVRGGALTTALAVLYYFYIIATRLYNGDQLQGAIQATILLGIVYGLVAVTIGSLKQRIDQLIEGEHDEKKRLQVILDQLPAGVIVTDSKGRVTHANKKVTQLLGEKLEKGYLIGEKPLLSTTQAGKVTPSKGPLRMALDTGKSIEGKELELTRKDGRKIYVQVNASVIKNKKNTIIAAASIINDITQQKELEKRKDDFINMASHELRTPVTSMLLYLDVLLAKEKETKNKEMTGIVSKVKYQTEKLQLLVNDLLDVSRIQSGKLRFKKERFNLSTLITETVLEIQRSAKGKIITFKGNKTVMISGDQFRIYQVIINLLTNAVKYSGDATDITILLKKEAGKAVFSVSDKGIGVTKGQQRLIFERLYQVNNQTKKSTSGLGLGLYISQQIVKRHKGKIWVKSEKGKGSTFYVSLPLDATE